MHDAIIIGSGPSGVAAAYKLQDRKILLIDVGQTSKQPDGLTENFFDIRKKAELYFDSLIGTNFESLDNIDKKYLSPKIKAPFQRYVIDGGNRFGSIGSETFRGFMSYAQGGLANAWGAQLYRFNDYDLKEFPISASDLEPYYDELTKLIGICGQDDDLTPFYGSTKGLLPPLQLCTLGADLFKKYTKQKKYFHQKKIYIGRPRLGILSIDYCNRKKCDYSNLDFFQPQLPYLYTPSVTLHELIAQKKLNYKPGYLVENYKELNGKVIVEAKNIDTGRKEVFESKKLILAAGTFGTAKIVLNSNEDFQAKLPLMDNALSYIPFLNFFRMGSRQEKCSLYTQLNLCYTGNLCDELVMGTFYAITGILHSDILFDMPLAVKSNIIVSRYALPAIIVLNLWYPAKKRETNYVELSRSGNLHINYKPEVIGDVERYLIRQFIKIGYFSTPFLCKYPMPGNGFHYAGTIPMRLKPTGKYETDSYGLLYGSKRVHVVDGSNFPSLPAKNLSFTIMANAMRIAENIKKELAEDA